MIIAVSTNAANLNKVYEDDRSTVLVSEKSRSGDKVEAYVNTSYKQNYQSKDCKRQFIGEFPKNCVTAYNPLTGE